MYQKSKRLTDVNSTKKKLQITLKSSPRKKCEQQVVRRSPRKAVRTRAALLARGTYLVHFVCFLYLLTSICVHLFVFKSVRMLFLLTCEFGENSRIPNQYYPHFIAFSGPGSNQSLPELELHGRSSTAPTRVDLIMQKSKQARCYSSDNTEKKHGRKSAETGSDVKEEEEISELLRHFVSFLVGCGWIH